MKYLLPVLSAFTAFGTLHAEDLRAKGARLEILESVKRPVAVSLTVDKSAYRAGDHPVVTVQTNEDCQITLIYEDASGQRVQLFPNEFIKDNRIRGGSPVKLLPAPNPQRPGSAVAISIFGPPFGREHFLVIAGEDTQGLTASAVPAGEVFPRVTTKAARIVSTVLQTNVAAAGFVSTTTVSTASNQPSGPVTATGKDGHARVSVITTAN